MPRTTNARVARYFDKAADTYDRQMGFFERVVLGDGRRWAVSQARGDVVELAAGTGLNFPLYPEQVSHVVAVELSAQMLLRARQRIADHNLAGRVEAHAGDAQWLDLPAESADTVLSTYAFCTIPDPLAASREAWRVLRPGGRLVLVEHGPATRALVRAVLHLLEPLSLRFGADHLTRDPVPYVTAAGFLVDEVHRGGRAGVVFRVLARKPAG